MAAPHIGQADSRVGGRGASPYGPSGGGPIYGSNRALSRSAQVLFRCSAKAAPLHLLVSALMIRPQIATLTSMATTTRDPLSLDMQVCYALAATSRSIIGLYRPVLEPLGLTHPQYLVMLALWERHPRTVADIGHALHLEPATLSPLLKRLETAGLITRARSETDERALAVTLTPAGLALRAEAEKVPEKIIERLGLPVEELERLRDILHVVLAAATRPQ